MEDKVGKSDKCNKNTTGIQNSTHKDNPTVTASNDTK